MDSPDCSNNDGAFASISRKCSRIRASPATSGSLSGFSSDRRSNGCTVDVDVDDAVNVVASAVVVVVAAASVVVAVVVVVFIAAAAVVVVVVAV